MRRVAFALVAGTVVVLGACASSGSGSGSEGPPGGLTTEQLVATGQTNLYQALQQLRPTWLRPRAPGRVVGTVQVTVFLDGSPFGVARDLSRFSVDEVTNVSYMSASEATTRYGLPGGPAGLILVRTGRR